MRPGAAIANTAWLATSLPEWLRFRRDAARLESAQRHLLAYYLQRNAATAFGRDHDFAGIRSWDDYAERVPARTYDDYLPWVEQIAAGSANVLTTDRVKLLEPTSGSSGAEKWVPFTRTLQAEFHRAVSTWTSDLFGRCPQLMGGRAYWSLTPQTPRDSDSATKVPIGFEIDSAYLGGTASRLVNLTLATAPELKHIRDMDQFWHMTLLQLLGVRDLRLISVWHPSYLVLLLQHLRRNWQELIDDLATGTAIAMPPLRVAADPSRSRELARIGPDNAAALWPALRLISCWGDAHAAACLADVRAEFPGVHLQPKGLVATEAIVTVPLGELRPLAIRSHFFEFRDGDGTIHPAWSLVQGETYAVIVTTGGGLYRYELGDRVEVTGFYRDTPSLRLLGREDNIADHYGEKLSETFVATCVDIATARHRIVSTFAMLAFDQSSDVPGYTLYIEAPSRLPDALASDLDSELRQNPHYDLCVRLGQLRPVGVFAVAAGAYETYAQVLVRQGMRLGDIKPTILSRFSHWRDHFRESRSRQAN